MGVIVTANCLYLRQSDNQHKTYVMERGRFDTYVMATLWAVAVPRALPPSLVRPGAIPVDIDVRRRCASAGVCPRGTVTAAAPIAAAFFSGAHPPFGTFLGRIQQPSIMRERKQMGRGGGGGGMGCSRTRRGYQLCNEKRGEAAPS